MPVNIMGLCAGMDAIGRWWLLVTVPVRVVTVSVLYLGLCFGYV